MDKHASYPAAHSSIKKEGKFKKTELRQVKYLNNYLEQDHRTVKKQYRFSMGYQSLETARNTIDGIEAMHMIFKGQIKELPEANALDVKRLIEDLFEVRRLAA